ncbi:MAG: ABC transporter permease [Verrucomicrobiales bacterium]
MRFFFPFCTLVSRELIRFFRQPLRLAGLILTPFLYCIVVSAGIGNTLTYDALPDQVTYGAFTFPGIMILLVFYSAIFSPVSTVEDRKEGFLQSILSAPISPASLVFAKIFAASLLALVQTTLMLGLAPLLGIPLPWNSIGMIVAVVGLVAIGFAGLGFVIAWLSDSVHSFQVVAHIFIIPLWLLAGAIVPLPAESWINVINYVNPMFYAVAAVQTAFYPDLLEQSITLDFQQTMIGCGVFAVATFLAGYILLLSRTRFAAH